MIGYGTILIIIISLCLILLLITYILYNKKDYLVETFNNSLNVEQYDISFNDSDVMDIESMLNIYNDSVLSEFIGTSCKIYDDLNLTKDIDSEYESIYASDNSVNQIEIDEKNNKENNKCIMKCVRFQVGKPDNSNKYKNIKDDSKWRPLWIKKFGEWRSYANKVPRLKYIASKFPNIMNMYISVLHPGEMIIENVNKIKMTKRYHYGLYVPNEKCGMIINSKKVEIKDKKGATWNENETHSIWNWSNEPMIILCVDFLNKFSGVEKLNSNLMCYMFKQK